MRPLRGLQETRVATREESGLEFPRETGLILRCAGKAGNPFQTPQGNRLSCRDQEGRRGSALQPHGLQHTRLPCSSPSPRACSNSCPLSRCHGVAKSRTRLSDFTVTFHFHALEKEMAPHSSVLAWRIPWTEEPAGYSRPGLCATAPGPELELRRSGSSLGPSQ